MLIEKFRLVGIKLPYKTTNENNQSAKDCGTLWQKFENEKILDLIPNKVSDDIYAVYFDYDKDETQPFSYLIGCRVSENSDAPDNLTKLDIPAQTYMKVTAKGVMTDCITDEWKKIWSSKIKRKFGFDFEIYDKRSRDWSNAEVDIFISIVDQ